VKKYLLLISLISTLLTYSQEKFTLTGTVKDQSSLESLIGVNIIIPELQTGTTSNEYGFYSLTLPKGNYNIEISYLGFESIKTNINLDKDISYNISLKESTEDLDEVVIKQNIERVKIKNPEMSVNTLAIETIKKMPVVFGEVDIIKSITLLPGVTNGGEGTSGFNVRGGAADQNLILLDEANVFNSSHLFGFFSVFNPDAIKNLKLYKGGIPARYGGRVSSVLDIYQKEGNKNEFHGSGGIGSISSRLLLEGPIKKEKGSFLVGGRSSYAHLFLPLFDLDNTAYFYDLNTKLSYKLNDNNSLYLSTYWGRDVFKIPGTFNNSFGNMFYNLRWNHIHNDKLFSNLSLIYSDYDYFLNLGFIEFDWTSGIKNFNLKYDFKNYISNKLKLEYGVNSIYYDFNPGIIEPTTQNSPVQSDELTKKYALESAAYFGADYKVSNKLSFYAGLRFSNFLRLGQEYLNIYENNNAVVFNKEQSIYETGNIIGRKAYDRSDVIKSFNNLEPRAAISYALTNNASIKASYNRMAQYIHLLSNTNSPNPLDVWTPSGEFIDPQLLNQFAIGYFKRFNNTYSLEIESFYKDVQNRIDYVDGADLIGNNAIEQVILNGESRAYGLEILFKKTEGRFKGWLSYTLSKSEQLTKGRTAEESGINNSQWYVTPYDKTHDISLTNSFEINKKWSLASNFIFQTGLAATFPEGQYQYNNITVPVFEQRNASRLPSYHRFDVSAIYKPYKPNKKIKGEWVFSVYNVYNRMNANSISFGQNEDTRQNEAVKLSIFGVVPSVTYNFKF
jgi:hypothetical protein